MLYPPNKVNTLTKKRRKKIWDIQKNIGADVKWDQKKEEPENEIKKNKL